MDDPIDLRTSLSIARTRFAAERTLMSWIRTSLAMITFGFTIIKFFQYLRGIPPTEHLAKMPGSTKLGLFLILLGLFSLIPATIEHIKALKLLHAMDKTPRWSYALIAAILVAMVGIYALMNSDILSFFW